MSKVIKCRPKNLTLEAMRVEKGSISEIHRWIRDPWVLGGNTVSEDSHFVVVNEDTEYEQTAYVGDYIVKGVTGLFRAYSGEDYADTFEDLS